MDKRYLLDQLAMRFADVAQVAGRAAADAAEAARSLATESEKREDSRVALEFGSLATGQAARRARAKADLEALEAFRRRELPRYNRQTPIGLGAIVDVHMETENGMEERTFILLPVGASTELTGPGGDGFLSVITPSSPVGKALIGKRAGESFDVSIKGDWHAWTVVDLC